MLTSAEEANQITAMITAAGDSGNEAVIIAIATEIAAAAGRVATNPNPESEP